MTQTKDIKAIGGIGASGWDVRKKLTERIEREQTARSLHKMIYTVEIEAEVTGEADMTAFLDVALHYPDWESVTVKDCVITGIAESAEHSWRNEFVAPTSEED